MNKHLEKYYAAYKAMKEAAIEAMKEYGKRLDVRKECKKKLAKQKGYGSEEEITEDELHDFILTNTYSCFFIGKHEEIYLVNIEMVRYNEETKDVDAYLESDDGYVSDWYPVSWISGDVDAVYQTVLDFLTED